MPIYISMDDSIASKCKIQFYLENSKQRKLNRFEWIQNKGKQNGFKT